MIPSVQEALSERFSSNADTKTHHRQLLVISGAEVWGLNQVEQLINTVINYRLSTTSGTDSGEMATHYVDILTCHADLPQSVHGSNDATSISGNRASTNNSQFRQHLGREYDLVVYNAWRGCKASALAALAGTVKKNGLFILLCPDLESWPQFKDDELAKRISWGNLEKLTSSRFIQHLVDAIGSDNNLMLLDEKGFSGENRLVTEQQRKSTQNVQQQLEVIAAVKKVATGHRKRPLVITAERGRGKSAALGIAVAELINDAGASSPKKILVTAPQKSSVETLFRHAMALSNEISDHLKFCAVDDVILNLPDADLLIIDEAAAIPVTQLQTLCKHYYRIVFSTTTNGYEGSGRGFEVRFKPWLVEHRPEAKFATLTLPFRWHCNDCLEGFWWKTLHLKPEQPDAILNGSNLKHCLRDPLEFKAISKVELLADQQLLNAVFSLLVDAHYQTTPDDLVALLDAPEQRLFVLFVNQPNQENTTPENTTPENITPENIAAVLSGSIEGEITDKKLALNILSGQRRIQGHMLPQQLAYGTGHSPFLPYSYFRVIRIAVRSTLRQRGLGLRLLESTQQWCVQNNIQLMGSSFGASAELLNFWGKSGFSPALLGFHRDKATAEFNVTVVKQLEQCSELSAHLNLVRENLKDLLNNHLTTIWQRLDNRIVIALLLALHRDTEKSAAISARDKALLALFYNGNRSLELSSASIQRLVLSQLKVLKGNGDKYALLIDYSVKKLSNAELVLLHNLKGKKQLLAELKTQAQLLAQADS